MQFLVTISNYVICLEVAKFIHIRIFVAICAEESRFWRSVYVIEATNVCHVVYGIKAINICML